MGIEKARFRNPVIPDCELLLKIEAIRSHGRVWKYKGDAFVNDGPEIRQENKRYGMEVEFDTVNSVFNINSGTTGEALAGGSVVGVAG